MIRAHHKLSTPTCELVLLHRIIILLVMTSLLSVKKQKKKMDGPANSREILRDQGLQDALCEH